MKEWFEEHIELLVYVGVTFVTVGLIVLGAFMTKWIVESDLPEWVKWWLLTR